MYVVCLLYCEIDSTNIIAHVTIEIKAMHVKGYVHTCNLLTLNDTDARLIIAIIAVQTVDFVTATNISSSTSTNSRFEFIVRNYY